MNDRTSRVVQDLRTQLYEDEYFRLVSAMVFVWGFLDTASTYIAIISHGTVQHEFNPFLRAGLEAHPGFLLGVKTIAVLAAGLIAILGRDYIVTVLGWRYYFHGVLLTGVIVTWLNLFSVYTAF